jgi:hypothetical protein
VIPDDSARLAILDELALLDRALAMTADPGIRSALQDRREVVSHELVDHHEAVLEALLKRRLD